MRAAAHSKILNAFDGHAATTARTLLIGGAGIDYELALLDFECLQEASLRSFPNGYTRPYPS